MQMRMLPCGSFFPVELITSYWTKNPAVLIKMKGRSEEDKEEEGGKCVKRWNHRENENKYIGKCIVFLY